MALNAEAARRVVSQRIATPLSLSHEEAAAAILTVATEKMVSAIKEITVDQGVDPRDAALIAGGGAAGFNVVPIARELGCRQVLLPRTAGALSAVGGLYSDVITEYRLSRFMSSAIATVDDINAILSHLDLRLDQYLRDLGPVYASVHKSFIVEARYPHQAWEIPVELPPRPLSADAIPNTVQNFQQLHDRMFAVMEDAEAIEFVTWIGRLTAKMQHPQLLAGSFDDRHDLEPSSRAPAFFAGLGILPTPRYRGNSLRPGDKIPGPAIIEEATATIVVYPESRVSITSLGSYNISVGPADDQS